MKKSICFLTIFLISGINLFSQGWVGNSSTDVLYPVNSNLNLTPLSIGIGTNNPTQQLHTTLGVRFEGLTQNNSLNRLLVSDIKGNLYWRDVSTISGGAGDHDWYQVGTTLPPNNIFNNKYTHGRIAIGANNPNYWRLFIDSGMTYIHGAIPSANLSSSVFFTGGPGTGLLLENESDYLGMLLEQKGPDSHDAVIYFGDNPGDENLKFCRATWNGTSHVFSELVRISANGNLGIGTNNPSQKLTVFNGTTTGTYTTTGWVHSSDKRLKKNIINVSDAMSLLRKINGVYFEWKDNSQAGRQLGFIAQDVKTVLPEVVYGKEGDIEKGETLSMAYQNIIPVLVEAIKEKDTEINELKTRIEKIEALLSNNTLLTINNEKTLSQNIPNPFSISTEIPYSIAKSGNISLDLYSIEGKFIKTIETGYKKIGDYKSTLDGYDLPSGTYIYSLKVNGVQVSKKAIKI